MWKCIRNANYSFAIVHGFTEEGKIDSNCSSNVQNAWDAGFESVDVYMTPCPRCTSPRVQVKRMFDHVRDVKYGKMWIDTAGVYIWVGDMEENKKYCTELITACLEIFGDKFSGVLADKALWETNFADYSAWSSLPLFWSHDDAEASFEHFYPFGGWKLPVMKHYLFGSWCQVCGQEVGLIYCP